MNRKTVVFKYARAVKQNVWNETRFTDFFTDFEKKNPTVLQSRIDKIKELLVLIVTTFNFIPAC